MGKIGVYLCECGPNIADRIDLERAIEELSSLEGVEVVAKHKLPCSPPGRKFVKENIRENAITHVVVGACSHKQHETTFMKVCEDAGLNPYLLQLVNIREQCAWMTPDKEEATEKAIRELRGAISRVRYHTALIKKEIECSPDILIIGGGISGIQASLILTSPSRKVYLVERTPNLGGTAVQFERFFQDTTANSFVKEKIEQIHANERIEVLTNSEVQEVVGFFGNYVARVKKPEEEIEIKVGAIVLATGYELYDPARNPKYGYGKVEDVYTALEFENMNASGNISLKNSNVPKSAAIVYCVGREEEGYCSKICCSYATKFSQYLKEKIPEITIHKFYYDLCTSKGEENVHFVRISDIEITQENGSKRIKYQTEDGQHGSVDAEMVILLSGIEPGSDAPKLAEMLNIELDKQGFFAEAHVKLRPVATSLEGVFMAGCAQGPKDIFDSVVQAEAVSGEILSALVAGKKLETEVMTSQIAETLCTGCQTCLSVCPYSAIRYDELKEVCVPNEILCRGCGSCASACPSNAITHKHFTTREIYQELIEALR